MAGILLAHTSQVAAETSLMRYEFDTVAMGVQFNVVLYAGSRETANRAAEAAFERIKTLDGILSDYDPKSELSRLGRGSPTPQPVHVSRPLWEVLRRADALARETDGAFDVTVGPLVKLWRRARRQKVLPKPDAIETARRSVGYRHMALDPRRRTVMLARPNMRLDLGGIAKGFAADEALRVLAEHGIDRALVDASGDLAVGAAPPRAKGWRVSVARLDATSEPGGLPGQAPSDSGRRARTLLLSHCGVATSGDAFQYLEIDGRRYSHILDPRTGIGLTTPGSVTVIAPDGTAADALASAVSVLGPERGLKLIARKCRCEALILRRVQEPGGLPGQAESNSDEIKTYESAGFKKYEVPDNDTKDEVPEKDKKHEVPEKDMKE